MKIEIAERAVPHSVNGVSHAVVPTVTRVGSLLWVLPAYLIGPLVVWVWAAKSRSFWFDETLTFWQTQRPVRDVVTLQANGFHPPAFHLGVYGWTLVLGDSTLALRAYSMAWGLAFMVAAYLLARELYGRRVAAIAALVLLYAPFVTWYATEARMYMQMLALGTLATWLLLRCERQQTVGRLAGYWVSAALVLLTHYFSSLIVAAHGVYFLGRMAYARGWWRAVWSAVKQFSIPMAAILAWLVFVAAFGSRSIEHAPIYAKPDVYTIFDTVVSILLGYHSPDVDLRLVAAWPVSFIVLAASIGAIGRMRASGLLLLVLAVVPTAILVLGSYVGPRPLFDPRYIAILCIPIFFWIALQLASIRSNRYLIPAVVAVVALMTTFTGLSLYVGNNPRIYDFEKAANLVAERRLPGDAVVVAPDFVTPAWVSVYSFNGPVFDAVGLKTGASAWRVFDSSAEAPRQTERVLRDWAEARGVELTLTNEAQPHGDAASVVGFITGSVPVTTTGRIWLVSTFEDKQVQSQVTAEEARRKIAAFSKLLDIWKFRQVTVRLYEVKPELIPPVERPVTERAPASQSALASNPEPALASNPEPASGSSIQFTPEPLPPEPAQVTHTVDTGENLTMIARRYGVEPLRIAEANRIAPPYVLYRGQTLVIPGASVPPPQPAELPESTPPLPTGAIHIVQTGEYLSAIASLYGVSPQAIADANRLTNLSIIYRGQELIIPGAAAVIPAESTPTPEPIPQPEPPPCPPPTFTHFVRPGENLLAIASLYGVPPQAIAGCNGLTNPSIVYRGQELNIPGIAPFVRPAPTPATAAAEPGLAPESEAAPGSPSVTHTVQAGENLATIAATYGVPLSAIMLVNGIANPNIIWVSEELTIPTSIP